ncbi:MAG: nucleoside triphosphate pyrophosphohydrolase [Candidatus Korobacteraceae bacterium]|jgi:MazG family protein
MERTGERFERAVAIMARLRAPGGCPWDREQTFDTIKQYTLEETYEVLEAIEKRDWAELPAELGDLLLQVLFYAEMAQEEGRFSIDDVLDQLSDKLVARHPHVFGEVKAETSAQVLRNWEAIKQQERRQKAGEQLEDEASKSILDGVSRAMPALLEALKLSNKAAHVGFDWPKIDGLFDKLHEEVEELKSEIKRIPPPGPLPIGRGIAGAREQVLPEELKERLEDEVGDLLFVLVNVARYLNVDPESALRQTNRKFRRRFRYVEQALRQAGKKPEEASLDEMEAHWQRSKKVGD